MQMRNKHGSYRLIWLKKSAQLRSFSQGEDVIRPTAGWYSRYGLNSLHFSLLFCFVLFFLCVWLWLRYFLTQAFRRLCFRLNWAQEQQQYPPTTNAVLKVRESLKIPRYSSKILMDSFLIQFLSFFSPQLRTDLTECDSSSTKYKST